MADGDDESDCRQVVRASRLQRGLTYGGLCCLLLAGVLVRELLISIEARNRATAERIRAERLQNEPAHELALAALAQAAVAQRRHDHGLAREALAAVPVWERDLEWQLLERSIRGRGRVLQLPGLRPRGLSWRSDGGTLYLAGHDGEVLEVAVDSLQIRRRMQSGLTSLRDCRLSPDGARLLLRSDTAVQVLEVMDGSGAVPRMQPSSACRWFDALRYLLQHGTDLRLYDLAGRELAAWKLDPAPACVAVDDGRLLVGMGDTVWALGPALPRHKERVFSDPGYEIEAIGRDQAGALYCSSRRGDEGELALRIQRGTTVERIGESFLRDERPELLRAVSGGFVFAYHHDRALYLKRKGLSELSQLRFEGAITALAVHPAGELLACARSGSLHLIDLPSIGSLDLQAGASEPRCLRFAGDALYSIDRDGAVRHRAANDGAVLETLVEAGRLPADPPLASLHDLATGTLLIATGNAVALHDGQGRPQTVRAGNAGLTCRPSPDGDLAITIDEDGAVDILALPSGDMVFTVAASADHPMTQHCAWSPSGSRIALVSEERELACSDVSRMQWCWSAVLPWTPHQMVSSEQGLLVAMDDVIHCYDWEDGALLGVLAGHRAELTALALDADRGRLVSGDREGWLLFWDLDELRQTLAFKAVPREIVCIAVAGERLAFMGGDRLLRCWHLGPGGVGDD